MKSSFLFPSLLLAAGMIPSAVTAGSILAGLLTSTAQAQTVVSHETFPNSFNTGFTAPAQNVNGGNFTGSTGTWNATSNSRATTIATAAYYSPVTKAIKLVNWDTAGIGAGDCHAASPTTNLLPSACSNDVKLTYKLYTYTVNASDTGSFFKVEFSADNGATWTAVQSNSSSQLYSSYGANGLTTQTVTIPANYRVSQFKYRFSGYKPANESHNFYLFIDEPKITFAPCGTLPVDLILFDGREQNSDVLLSWTTASEINFSNFGIERSSNGSDFITIGTVQATGNPGSNQNYSFTDVNAPSNGNLYYRLRLNDTGGQFKYSKIVSMKLAVREGTQQLYPVPAAAGREITLAIRSAATERATLTVTDMSGRVRGQSSIQLNNGSQTLTLPSSKGLRAGNYIVTLTLESGEKVSHKFIVQ